MNKPSSISREALSAAVRALGLDPKNVKSVKIDRDGVKVVEFTVNEHGGRYVDWRKPNRYVTHATTIPVHDTAPLSSPLNLRVF